MLGLEARPLDVPWFWSDQGDIKVQIAGLPVGATRCVVRGDGRAGKFAVFHLDENERLVCAEAVNDGQAFMAAKRWIAGGQRLDPEALPDRSRALKDVATDW